VSRRPCADYFEIDMSSRMTSGMNSFHFLENIWENGKMIESTCPSTLQRDNFDAAVGSTGSSPLPAQALAQVPGRRGGGALYRPEKDWFLECRTVEEVCRKVRLFQSYSPGLPSWCDVTSGGSLSLIRMKNSLRSLTASLGYLPLILRRGSASAERVGR
jgi:hypothetical protein